LDEQRPTVEREDQSKYLVLDHYAGRPEVDTFYARDATEAVEIFNSRRQFYSNHGNPTLYVKVKTNV
jgi:hypothetical protein